MIGVRRFCPLASRRRIALATSKPVRPGHVHVQYDDVKRYVPVILEDALSIADESGIVPPGLQHHGDNLLADLIVFCYQDMQAGSAKDLLPRKIRQRLQGGSTRNNTAYGSAEQTRLARFQKTNVTRVEGINFIYVRVD